MNWLDVFLCNWISAYMPVPDTDPDWQAIIRETSALNIEARIREIVQEELAKANK